MLMERGCTSVHAVVCGDFFLDLFGHYYSLLEKLEPFLSLSPRSWPQDQQELGTGQLGKDRFDMAW